MEAGHSSGKGRVVHHRSAEERQSGSSGRRVGENLPDKIFTDVQHPVAVAVAGGRQSVMGIVRLNAMT